MSDESKMVKVDELTFKLETFLAQLEKRQEEAEAERIQRKADNELWRSVQSASLKQAETATREMQRTFEHPINPATVWAHFAGCAVTGFTTRGLTADDYCVDPACVLADELLQEYTKRFGECSEKEEP